MLVEGSVNPKNAQLFRFNWISVAFFAAVHALALLAPCFFSWSALGLAIFLHWLFGSIGICLRYHWLLTHRSLQVPKGLEYVIAVLGALALQGEPIFWVAGHRRHHTYTKDIDKDPYSAKQGVWWSHMGWMLYEHPEFFEYESNRKFAITGYRSHESDDNSRNLWWAAILTYGEGCHNNHYAYPNVAKAGWKWWVMPGQGHELQDYLTGKA